MLEDLEHRIELTSGSPHPDAAALIDLYRDQQQAYRIADLWWVVPDMTALVADTAFSGSEHPEWSPPVDQARGLVVFDGDLPVQIVDVDAGELHIAAISWMPATEASHAFHDGVTRQFFTQAWTRFGDESRFPGKAPLAPLPDARMRSGGQVLLQDLLWDIVSVTMLLANEPKVADRRPANFDRDGDPRDTRSREVSDVQVIDLRTVRDWSVGPDGTAETEGRTYSHRWIVRGHMSTYWVGKGRTRREKRWISPYVAGPEGAPLMPKEKVWVWRH